MGMTFQIFTALVMLVMAACQVPMEGTTALVEGSEKTHVLGDLSITVSDTWQVEKPQPGGSMYWLRSRRNTVLLQNGSIANPSAHFDLDSSLAASFRERRIPGEMDRNRNAPFIHGIRPVRSGGGDSLYIYMEDTVTWRYYHFDGHFQDRQLLDGFMDSMRGSELIR